MAIMDRGNSFWYGREISPKNVGEYLKELKKERKELGDMVYEIPKLIKPSKDQFDSVFSVLDKEIEYCKFYFEYNSKARKENFNQWVFYKEEDRQKKYGWHAPQGDCWAINNGRVKATISIKKGVTTKIWLELENNSEYLTFYNKRYNEKEEKRIKHLSKKENIKQYIQDLKIYVEEVIFPEKLYPYTKEKRNVELLNNLLHTEVNNE